MITATCLAAILVVGSAAIIFYPAYARVRDPWPDLERSLRLAEPDGSFRVAFTQRHRGGCVTILSCDDARLERVYVTDLATESACDELLERLLAVPALQDLTVERAEVVDPDQASFACYAEGDLRGSTLTAQVDTSYGPYPHGVPSGKTFLALNAFEDVAL